LCANAGAAARQPDEVTAPVPNYRPYNVRLGLPEVRVFHNEWRAMNFGEKFR
jgi:hypothetical protein